MSFSAAMVSISDRISLFGEAFLAIVVYCGKGVVLLQLRHCLAQQAIGVPFGVVQHPQTQLTEVSDARRKRERLGLDHTAGIEDDLIW